MDGCCMTTWKGEKFVNLESFGIGKGHNQSIDKIFKFSKDKKTKPKFRKIKRQVFEEKSSKDKKVKF
jgi:hypothetical protein